MRQVPALRRVVLLMVFSALSLADIRAQVTAKQGTQDPTEFSGSMVLEAPFPPAISGYRTGEWYTTPDYGRMRLYRCDRVYITLFQFKVGPAKNGTLPVSVRIWLANPAGNHDKNVELVLQVHNGEQNVAEARRSIKVEESDIAKRDIELPVKVAELSADPATQLRVIVRTKDI